jgi:Cu/Ag efflux pump CusA
VPLEPAEDAPLTGRGRPQRLGDVTDVVQDHQPLIGDAVVGGGTGLLLVVEKFPGANTLEVTRGVEKALDELRPGLSGLRIDSSAFRAADFVEAATDNLTLAVILGCALLALVLLALLLAWRTALVCMIAFALALTTAALVLSITEAAINALVFAGLAAAVGVVIDDAVVDVQNIRRRLSDGTRENSGGPAATVLAAAVEMRSPLAYATAILALTALPVLFIEGVSGAFVEPAVRAYLLALAASMLVALTVTPVLSLLLFSKPRGEDRGSPLLRWVRARYDAALARVIGTPRAALVAGGVALLAGLALIPALHGPLIPAFKDNALLVRLDGPPGTSRPEMSRILAAVSRDLRAVRGVRDVGGHVGRAVTGDQVVDVNSSELWVKVDRNADYDATRAAVQRVVDGYPGFRRSVLTYAKQRIRDVAATDDRQADQAPAASADLDVLTGADRRSLVVRVFGEDLGVLRHEGERIKQLLSTVDGVVDPRVERFVEQPTVAIEVDLARAQRYGIKPGDVRRNAATLLSGIQVGSLFEQQKVFEVVVRATPDARRSLTDIRRLLIDTPSGGHVRLGDIADVRVRPTPQVIQRDASSRRIDVSADVSGRGLGAVQREVRQRLQRVGFPLEYHAQVIGDATGPQSSPTRLVGFALAAAIGIFLLLQAAFRSWRLASAVFLALPVALVGGELAGIVDGGRFSLGSLLGLLAVLGIAARSCVVLGMHYDRLQREGEVVRPRLVLRGAGDRVGPILLTAAGTAAVLLPVVALGDRAGYEIVHPMAVVMLGGLVTSTLLTLFLIPAVYARFGPAAGPGGAGEPIIVRRWSGAEPAPDGVPGGEVSHAP